MCPIDISSIYRIARGITVRCNGISLTNITELNKDYVRKRTLELHVPVERLINLFISLLKDMSEITTDDDYAIARMVEINFREMWKSFLKSEDNIREHTDVITSGNILAHINYAGGIIVPYIYTPILNASEKCNETKEDKVKVFKEKLWLEMGQIMILYRPEKKLMQQSGLSEDFSFFKKKEHSDSESEVTEGVKTLEGLKDG